MRNVVTTLVAVGAISVFGAASALAGPINPINTRPVAVGPPAAGEASLQSILDTIYGAGTHDVLTSQQAPGMWEHPGGGVAVVAPVLQFEYAGNASTNTFGIWSDEGGTITTAQIFSGPDGPGTITDVEWLPTDTNTVIINGVSTSGISQFGFGFYLGKADGTKYYSVDSLNPTGPQMLAYVGNGDEWLFASEDLPFVSGTSDFNDMIVTAESIDPVPEPGSMMLFGTGLFGLGGAIRRRLAKRA